MDKAKILIVEDDEFLCEVYLETLKDDGYIVDSAKDGDEGMKKMRQGGYDLVLLDIILPKMDGLDIMRRLKAEGTVSSNKRVVFLTNLDKDEEIKEALRLGDGYLIKSQLTPGDLSREVKMHLAKNAPSTA